MLSLLACVSSPLFAATATTLHRPVHHARRHRLHWTLWNPMFRPSHESLLLQNAEVDRLELPRIEDDDELEALKFSGALLPIIAGETLRFDPRLDPSRRYCRPWTRDFLEDLSEAYYKQFHSQIQVNSAVRTVQVVPVARAAPTVIMAATAVRRRPMIHLRLTAAAPARRVPLPPTTSCSSSCSRCRTRSRPRRRVPTAQPARRAPRAIPARRFRRC